MKTLTYADSLAGLQNEEFNSFKEIKQYIEEFQSAEDSAGFVYEAGELIASYNSIDGRLTWRYFSPKEEAVVEGNYSVHGATVDITWTPVAAWDSGWASGEFAREEDEQGNEYWAHGIYGPDSDEMIAEVRAFIKK